MNKVKMNKVKKQKKQHRRKPMKRPKNLLVWKPGVSLSPLPPRFITSFYMEADYKIPSATAGTFEGQIQANNPQLPFFYGSSSAFPSFTFLGPGTEGTLEPSGWSLLANTHLWQYYKVLKSELSVKVSAAVSTNNMSCTVIQLNNPALAMTVYNARIQPFARSANFYVSKQNEGCHKDGYLHVPFNASQIIGLSNLEAKADIGVLGDPLGLPPLIPIFWRVYLKTDTLDVTGTSAALFQCRVRYDVELYDNSVAGLPAT